LNILLQLPPTGLCPGPQWGTSIPQNPSHFTPFDFLAFAPMDFIGCTATGLRGEECTGTPLIF